MLRGRSDILVLEVPPLLTTMFAESMTAALDHLSEEVQVVVLAGADRDVFSLGMDLESFVRERADPVPALRAIGGALTAIHGCSRATLGVARGRAVGGGVGLLAACDWVVASDDATFALPEMLWGFVPAAIWPVIVARMGPARARAWAMTAFARDAAAASRAGLVDEVVPPGDVEPAARRAVRQLARPDRAAIGLLRSWSTESARLPVEEAILRGAELSAVQLVDELVRARLHAYFVEGRPAWKENQ